MHADTCPELTDPPGGTVVSDGLTAMYSCVWSQRAYAIAVSNVCASS